MEKVYVIRRTMVNKKSKNNMQNATEDYIFGDEDLAVEFMKLHLVDYKDDYLDFKISEGYPFSIYEDENEAQLIALKSKDVLSELPQVKYKV